MDESPDPSGTDGSNLATPISTRGPGWLFVPADRPDRFAKAAASADLVIIDLEDAVRAADKERARQTLRTADLDVEQTCIRINGFATADFAADLALVRELGVRTIMLPMTEEDQPLDLLSDFQVIALVETAKGVSGVESIAAVPCVQALALGSADLQLDLRSRALPGAESAFDDLLAFARTRLLFAARSFDIAAIDSAHVAITDESGLAGAASTAAAYGFDGKLAIHPRQVPLIRRAFAPTSGELEWARAVVRGAHSHSVGAFALDGELIDEVVIRRAEMLLRLAS
ncbi:HpcH/HpaI aldolase/citrate lyase family protein [Brevibacterium sp. GP-SGM9]|uniref:HpcH/HpaI aldolase/citrate lyase family protein n=1 Tax=unclassified Brevibacterium TaxID=2614124 RepID=UPI001E4C11A9|nr:MULTISPECIES: CoA ester lyase [unclassified Brevibacterium]MCD1286143.1 CoA ester lyase [Brevibacterium sp. CCUG 69071]MDK8433500.1 CoA ester lyase [Brevibacterium sp. H-BE7]